ncbi:MAG: 3-phosphoshikimate 1-carboxyvinyltransferase [Oscillospiraceae bacterium]|jgi:3-phosphoshikimate 1-carboxyvinyltransferase|nr:3-phosphoshikimate 1-carboxyvinyltransferase [Oscillospiraceae bacterium]
MTRTLAKSRVCGKLRAIASKSDFHRLLIAASLAEQPCKIMLEDAPSNDILATVDCLNALGASITMEGGKIRVAPIKRTSDECWLDCGESGSTLRFLLPIAAAHGKKASFIGKGKLPQRPIKPLLDELLRHGVKIREDAHAMLAIEGQLRAGDYGLPGNVSSQFVSGLLFALPLLEGNSTVCITSPLESSGYADMTIQTLRRFGIRIEAIDNGWAIAGGQSYRSPCECLRPEGDWSNAAFWLAAGALAGDVSVAGLDANSMQPDRQIADVLRKMGADISPDLTVRQTALRAIDFDASGAPDLVPIVSVLMALAEGASHITNAARLRVKECDRLQAVAETINALGGDCVAHADGLTIRGVARFKDAALDSYNDHRIAMSIAVAGLRTQGALSLTRAEAVQKSYPHFWEDYDAVCAFDDAGIPQDAESIERIRKFRNG